MYFSLEQGSLVTFCSANIGVFSALGEHEGSILTMCCSLQPSWSLSPHITPLAQQHFTSLHLTVALPTVFALSHLFPESLPSSHGDSRPQGSGIGKAHCCIAASALLHRFPSANAAQSCICIWSSASLHKLFSM